ncbi:MAG: hypothetical protein JXQ83_08885 [Candidatus Glassbacteria bacterium]|nr:hypothetical protein [Candidatus Glassbacteria bacterium]
MYRGALYPAVCLALALAACGEPQARQESGPELQTLEAVPGRPPAFPRRIWAACDFELDRKDVVWLGEHERSDIPAYPGNQTAARAVPLAGGPVKIIGIKPVSYPRMGFDQASRNKVYFRYRLEGEGRVFIQLFARGDHACHRAELKGLGRGEWSEAVVDLGGPGGGPGFPLPAGLRMYGLVMALEPSPQGGDCELIVDDVICFADGGAEQAAAMPFPGRVICLWGFDVVDEYHPWTHTDYRVLRKGEMLRNDWGAAQALPRANSPGKRIRLIIDPPQQVGRTTRLSFRYRLDGASSFQVQIFDLTDRDNRHIALENVDQGAWQQADLDFTGQGIKNDGNQTPFLAGNLVDDIFFFPLQAGEEAELLIDDVVLYDAAEK